MLDNVDTIQDGRYEIDGILNIANGVMMKWFLRVGPSSTDRLRSLKGPTLRLLRNSISTADTLS